jgi:hypothetical protein
MCTSCGGKRDKACSLVVNSRLKNGGCCYCLDKRTPSQTFTRFVDGIGDIDTRRYGLPYPKDILYCVNCKMTTVSTAELDILLKKAYLKAHPELVEQTWAIELMEEHGSVW